MHTVLHLTSAIFLSLLFVHCSPNIAYTQEWLLVRSTSGNIIGESLTAPMKSAPFPHTKRDNGHIYDGKSYPAAQHYRDSSVMIFLPKGFRPQKTLDFVVYLHGWYNSIDSATAQFRIAEQFAESRSNAVLVFPEGPKFAPDSFAGKLEDSCGLQRLCQETLETLRRTKNINARLGNVILAGHSGAYRGIAYMLLRGGVSVREVWLFDALYGQPEKFAHWLEHDFKRLRGRFINIYTDDGGTKAETEKLMEDLAAWRIPFRAVEEKALTTQDLKRSGIVFIHTDLQHNDVIARREQFRRYLETSSLGGSQGK
ncbi:MAG: hypothetical protein ACOVSW_03775 [Candidatus Kapaibacteriota bacterium]